LFRLTGQREFAVIPGQQIVQVVLEQFSEADGRFQFLAFGFLASMDSVHIVTRLIIGYY
jgi:hypothetical protein